MLVLSRKAKQQIQIGPDVTISGPFLGKPRHSPRLVTSPVRVPREFVHSFQAKTSSLWGSFQ